MLGALHEVKERAREDFGQAENEQHREQQDTERDAAELEQIRFQETRERVLTHADAHRAERAALDGRTDVADAPAVGANLHDVGFFARRRVQFAQVQRHSLREGMRHDAPLLVEEEDICDEIIVALRRVNEFFEGKEIARLDRLAAQLRHFDGDARTAPLKRCAHDV